MDDQIKGRISQTLGISKEGMARYTQYYADTISPKIKKKYLSHLVTTIEDMVNEKKTKVFHIKENKENFKRMIATKTLRLYSIVLIPMNLNKEGNHTLS
ncbi:MAG: hypothetical protein Ta2B_04350 [Termitinemataceae bacterium]|nr:MAG: hypothetical protein Ta2B_04350 [Termitinemataceae bacterium]